MVNLEGKILVVEEVVLLIRTVVVMVVPVLC
jgi:hypothetical protein